MYSAEASAVIPAEVGTVWSYISSYPNFPQFIGHIEQIVMLGDATSEWKLSGSAATPMILKVVTTESSPARRLSWQSLEGNIETQGSFSLEPRATIPTSLCRWSTKNPRVSWLKPLPSCFKTWANAGRRLAAFDRFGCTGSGRAKPSRNE